MFNRMTIKMKLQVAGGCISVLILALIFSVWQGVSYVGNKIDAATTLERGANHIQMLLRAANEVAITESSSASLLLARNSVANVDETIQRLESDLQDAPLRQLLREKLEPSWQGVNRQVAEFLKLDRISVQNDNAMLKLGALISATDALFVEVESMARLARAGADTAISATVTVVGGVALTIFLVINLLFYVLYRRITRSLDQAVTIAERVASCDLTSRIESTAQDETGRLLAALKKMNDSLRHIVESARTSAHAVMTTAKQLVADNSALSQRTEEQAAGIEETAASMEELTTTVQLNAEDSKQARQLVTHAHDIAAQGGATVGQVVVTMDTINESSKKIVNIVGVIEGIAFQTNLLALNAAVEAARAGEQGRGFAVVAHEVRELAHRSAQAAKEIKELIGDSVQKVGSGTVLVQEAGKTMAEIIVSVKNVSDIVSRISASSNEQSSGIEQVNHAISLMDGVTQENARLAQEITAAAEGLEGQAAKLSKVVDVFRLETATTGSKPAAVTPRLKVVVPAMGTHRVAVARS